MSEELRIEQLVRRERFYRDTSQWENWRDCYHPDSSQTHIDISWYKGEIDPFVDRSKSLSSAGVSPTHTLTPIDTRISPSGSRAYSISGAQISTRFEFSGHEFDLVADLRLVSRLEKISGEAAAPEGLSSGGDRGEWKLVSLEGIYIRDRILPVFPLTGAVAAEMPEIEVGKTGEGDGQKAKTRESYKCLIWNIERKGLKARRDLPGVDWPESVEGVMRRCDEWVG